MTRRAILLASVLGLALAGCGGGGGAGSDFAVVSTPPPPAAPPVPTAQFLAAPLSTQEFAVSGDWKDANGNMSTATGDLPRVRFDASLDRYQVAIPGRAWENVIDHPNQAPPSGSPNVMWTLPSGGTLINYTGPSAQFAPSERYAYSSLASFYSESVGDMAFGIATPNASVPVTGSASYQGMIAGQTNELVDYGSWDPSPATVSGSINFAFNFGAGTLSGAVNPFIYGFGNVAIPSMAFTNTVLSSGSNSFSGEFSTALPGANGFTGQFTGPAAQELIGSFRFPYISPDTGKTYDAAGAFVAKQ